MYALVSKMRGSDAEKRSTMAQDPRPRLLELVVGQRRLELVVGQRRLVVGERLRRRIRAAEVISQFAADER